MAMFAASNIAHALESFEGRGYARLRGLIQNCRNIADEGALVGKLAEELRTDIIGIVPRSPLVQQAEAEGKTVVELFPNSPQAQIYDALSRVLVAEGEV